MKKHYTPYEANLTLPLVKRIVADIMECAGGIKALMANGIGPHNKPRYDQLADQMEDLIAELEELGCFYKDWNFDKGLVDFPATIEGKDVYLCWRSDESDIRWYHGLHDGFQGRLPIPEHLLPPLEKSGDRSG